MYNEQHNKGQLFPEVLLMSSVAYAFVCLKEQYKSIIHANVSHRNKYWHSKYASSNKHHNDYLILWRLYLTFS